MGSFVQARSFEKHTIPLCRAAVRGGFRSIPCRNNRRRFPCRCNQPDRPDRLHMSSSPAESSPCRVLLLRPADGWMCGLVNAARPEVVDERKQKIIITVAGSADGQWHFWLVTAAARFLFTQDGDATPLHPPRRLASDAGCLHRFPVQVISQPC